MVTFERGDAVTRSVVGGAYLDPIQEMARKLMGFFSGVSYQLVTFPFHVFLAFDIDLKLLWQSIERLAAFIVDDWKWLEGENWAFQSLVRLT